MSGLGPGSSRSLVFVAPFAHFARRNIALLVIHLAQNSNVLAEVLFLPCALNAEIGVSLASCPYTQFVFCLRPGTEVLPHFAADNLNIFVKVSRLSRYLPEVRHVKEVL